MTSNELAEKGFVEVSAGQWVKRHDLNRWLRASRDKPDTSSVVAGANADEKGGQTRFRVCVVRYSKRLLDPDNLSAKWLIDCVRKAGLIPDDSAKYVDVAFKQSKGKTKTEIIIDAHSKSENT